MKRMNRCHTFASMSILYSAIVWLGGCDQKPAPSPSGNDTTQVAFSSPPLQCLDTAEFSPAFIQKYEAQLSAVGDSFGSMNVPRNNEAHDCQEIITGPPTSRRYGGVLTTWLLEKAPTGAMYAAGVNVGGLVYHGADLKNDLNIENGSNCLIVKGDSASNTGWKAWLFKKNPAKKCELTDFPHGDPIYDVWRYPSTGPAGQPVALRIIDTPAGYFIGLQCLDQWCIIGASTPPTDPNRPNDAWGDYQRMARYDSTKKRLVPTELWGRVTPDPNYDSDETDSYYGGPKGVPAAKLQFWGTDQAAIDAYVAKYHLKNATELMDPAGVSISLRKDGNSWVFIYNNHPTVQDTIEHVGVPSMVHRSARWRWDDKDEGVWVACPGGCCGGW